MTRRIVLAALLCAATGCARVLASQSASDPAAAVSPAAAGEEAGKGKGEGENDQKPDAPWLGATHPDAGAKGDATEPAEAEEPEKTDEAAVERAKALFMEGQKAFEIGDFAAAATKFEEAFRMAPDKWALAFNAGQAWARAGDCGRAMPMFQHALANADTFMKTEVRSAMNGCGARQ